MPAARVTRYTIPCGRTLLSLECGVLTNAQPADFCLSCSPPALSSWWAIDKTRVHGTFMARRRQAPLSVVAWLAERARRPNRLLRPTSRRGVPRACIAAHFRAHIARPLLLQPRLSTENGDSGALAHVGARPHTCMPIGSPRSGPAEDGRAALAIRSLTCVVASARLLDEQAPRGEGLMATVFCMR